MLPVNVLINVLKNKLGLNSEQIQAHQKQASIKNQSLENFFVRQNIVEEKQLYQWASELLKINFVLLKEQEIKKENVDLIPAQFAENHNVVAFDRKKTTLSIALTDPTDIQTIEFVRRKTGLSPKVFITTPTQIKETLREYHSNLASDKVIEKLSKQEEEIAEEGELKKVAQEVPIINILNSILEHAVFENSSDIHIEPTENGLIVRYRIDGILRQVMTLPKHVQNGIVARVKILAHLKIDEHMIPQDGRFKIDVHDEALAFRVSVMPVYGGEKIVMRLLHEGSKPLTLDQLGFHPGPKQLVEDSINKPHGMVLVTGPTGSGKTTTLYSILGKLNTAKVNICTIEDPIEYHITGINQSQINEKAGFSFANGLRAFLRQDPDIIMVGEIRDQETAEIAVHSAMTGHLVLSTLHTNDAPTTIPRLTDMNIPPFLVAFTLNCIIAQRLVRRLCKYCAQALPLQKDELKELSRLIKTEVLNELFDSHGIKLTDQERKLEQMTFFRAKGCKRCHNTGYKGRIGIYEVLETEDQLSTIINSGGNAQQIRQHAIESQQMITMLQDGVIKAKQGITTIEEILRVTRE